MHTNNYIGTFLHVQFVLELDDIATILMAFG